MNAVGNVNKSNITANIRDIDDNFYQSVTISVRLDFDFLSRTTPQLLLLLKRNTIKIGCNSIYLGPNAQTIQDALNYFR